MKEILNVNFALDHLDTLINFLGCQDPTIPGYQKANLYCMMAFAQLSPFKIDRGREELIQEIHDLIGFLASDDLEFLRSMIVELGRKAMTRLVDESENSPEYASLLAAYNDERTRNRLLLDQVNRLNAVLADVENSF